MKYNIISNKVRDTVRLTQSQFVGPHANETERIFQQVLTKHCPCLGKDSKVFKI